MIFDEPIRKAIARVGLTELEPLFGPAEGGRAPREELLAEIDEALANEEADEREEELIEILLDNPHCSEVPSRLVSGGWLADRPVELGLLAWDALNLTLFHPDDHEVVDQMREAARQVRTLLPPPTVFRVILNGSALSQFCWQSLQTRRHIGTPATEVGRAKMAVLRTGGLTPELAELLIDAATDEADLEAGLILERYDGWTDPEDQKALLAEAVLDRVFALQVVGMTTVASFMLKLLQHMMPLDEEAMARQIDLLIGQHRLDLAADLCKELLSIDGLSEDLRTGVPARIAVMRGESDRASELLARILSRPVKRIEEYVEEHPWTVIAASEHTMVAGVSAPIPVYLNNLLVQEPDNWHGHRLQCYLNFLEALRRKEAPTLALHAFLNCLIAYPSDGQLWVLFNRMAELEQMPELARKQVLHQVLTALPESVTVWLQVIEQIDPERQPGLRKALQRRLSSQTAI